MNSLDLYLTSSPELQLVKTCFYYQYNSPIVSVRGKNLFNPSSKNTFLWSSGVKSLLYLLTNTVCNFQMGAQTPYILSGAKKSLAHSLALTLIKEPKWIAEMFGTDSDGKTHARQLILIRNQYFKLGDEVELAINPNFLPLSEVNFYLDNSKINSLRELRQVKVMLDVLLNLNNSTSNPEPERGQLNFDFF